jgi:hypothetical protein
VDDLLDEFRIVPQRIDELFVAIGEIGVGRREEEDFRFWLSSGRSNVKGDVVVIAAGMKPGGVRRLRIPP